MSLVNSITFAFTPIGTGTDSFTAFAFAFVFAFVFAFAFMEAPEYVYMLFPIF